VTVPSAITNPNELSSVVSSIKTSNKKNWNAIYQRLYSEIYCQFHEMERIKTFTKEKKLKKGFKEVAFRSKILATMKTNHMKSLGVILYYLYYQYYIYYSFLIYYNF
jgi:hypothetical protein